MRERLENKDFITVMEKKGFGPKRVVLTEKGVKELAMASFIPDQYMCDTGSADMAMTQDMDITVVEILEW